MLQDGRLFPRSDSKESSVKGLAIRSKELGPCEALKYACVLEKKDFVTLHSKFVHFSNFVGMQT